MTVFARFQIALTAVAAITWHAPAHASADHTSLADKQHIVCLLQDTPIALTALQQNHPEYIGVTCPQIAAGGAATPAVRTNKSVRINNNVTEENVASAQLAKGGPRSKQVASTDITISATKFLLRNDWADLGLLGAGCNGPFGAVSTSKAKGASLSFTRDYAANNKIWAAQAMGAAVFSKCTDLRPKPGGGDSGIFERSLAMYAQINSDYNSNATFAKKNNLDTRTVGLAGELAYLNSGDIDVVRIIPNVVFNNIKNTTAFAVNAQYIPVWISKEYIWHAEGVPGDLNWANFQFDPTFDVQYANAMGHSQPLQFSGKDQSLRLGPELTFLLNPLIGPDFFSHMGFSETFHPWYEVYARRRSYWWDNSIFYNLTDNFAVKLSYQRGLDENSGTMTNQYIASLTGKI